MEQKKEEKDLDLLNAAYYKKNSQEQYGRAKEFINESFPDNSNILDAGCGDGKITAEIASLVPNGKVLGIDASSNMIEFASNSFEIPNLKFECSKIEEFSTKERFDYIICLSCLLWVRKPKQALEKMIKLLKPKGKLLVLTYLKESSYIDIFEETLEEFPLYQKKSAAHTMLSADEHLNILNSHNLSVETFKIEDKVSTYPTKQDLKNYLKGWVASYVPLPEELHDMFLDKAVTNSLKFSSSSKNDSSIHLPFKVLHIKATEDSK